MNASVAISTRTENLAKLACAYSGLAWGLFWLPLRAMDGAGISGTWATLAFYVVPLAMASPLLFWRWRQFIKGGWAMHSIAIAAACSLVLYSNSMLYTEVIPAMLLYYLTPVWSTFLARLWLGEAITPVRVVAIAVGLIGMLVIFGADSRIPVPRNIGDWMGLGSGVMWAVAATMMRRDPNYKAVDLSIAFMFWATVVAGVMVLLPISTAMPDINDMIAVLPWLIPVLAVIVLPATFATMWGAPLLNPGVVALMFMTEISVGTITAAIWAGEPFGIRQMVGVTLIASAGLAEVIALPLSKLRFRRD